MEKLWYRRRRRRKDPKSVRPEERQVNWECRVSVLWKVTPQGTDEIKFNIEAGDSIKKVSSIVEGSYSKSLYKTNNGGERSYIRGISVFNNSQKIGSYKGHRFCRVLSRSCLSSTYLLTYLPLVRPRV